MGMARDAYARAGVDITLGNRVKSGIGVLVRATHRTGVIGTVGGFGGCFDGRKISLSVSKQSVAI